MADTAVNCWEEAHRMHQNDQDVYCNNTAAPTVSHLIHVFSSQLFVQCTDSQEPVVASPSINNSITHLIRMSPIDVIVFMSSKRNNTNTTYEGSNAICKT